MSKVIPAEQIVRDSDCVEHSSAAIHDIDYAEHKYCRVNNAEYCYLAAGHGPMLLLIHGYPDNACSWEHQIRYFCQQGYGVIVPFTRGYLPTQTDSGSYFDRATLANDMAQLI